MAEAFHGTPITPNRLLKALGAERNYCVSYYRPDQVELLTAMAVRRLMLDNGAFSAWQESMRRLKLGKPPIIFDQAYWAAYYVWVRQWLRPWRGDFFVIPDVIDAGTQEQEALIRECPADLLPYGWAVWHMDESVERLISLIKRFGRACIGSTGEFMVVGSPTWRERMDEVFTALKAEFGIIPPLHMLRGLQCTNPDFDYAFDQLDSADFGRNHNRIRNVDPADAMARKIAKCDRWDRQAAALTKVWPPRRLTHPPPRLFGQAA